MALLSLQNVTFAFSHPAVVEDVILHIHHGERIGLVGRNGEGKSTLMRLMTGELSPDEGDIVLENGAKVAYLTQHVPSDVHGTIYDQVAEGVPEFGSAIAEYHRLDQKSRTAPLNDAERPALERVSHEIALHEGWDTLQRIERTLTEMNLDPEVRFESLSAGMKRRVLLAQALVNAPDLLLLDEPTNHLDIDSIVWLQEFLARFSGTLIFVTHDRAFLQALATRIVEVERGRLFDWTCDYATFLKRRDAMLESEATEQALFDKKLAEEERWIRQGIKARRTRNEGRVRALMKMREERHMRRQKLGQARMQIQEAERSGSLVVRLENVSFAYGDTPIIRDFSTTVFRSDRIGLIGPNGAGKTTLLKILLGELKPDHGKVRFGTQLAVGYFDQLRAQLDESRSVRDNVADGAEIVMVGGQRKHVVGYLQDFLFTPQRAQTRVGFLSGGERNRLLLAKLFTKPANVLVLDEPTNDLDAETLELLEQLLADYAGTVLLVSHDRTFLNNVVTSTFAFEGDGIVREYDGGYDDWLRQREASEVSPAPEPSPSKSEPAPAAPEKSKAKKLSFKDQRELQTLPQRIEELETRQQEYHALMADPNFYQRDGHEIARTKAELEELERELSDAYVRWEALES